MNTFDISQREKMWWKNRAVCNLVKVCLSLGKIKTFKAVFRH